MTATKHAFSDQRADEVVIFIQHRHWAILSGRMARWVALMAIPIGVVVVLLVTGNLAVTVESAEGVAIVLGASVFVLFLLVLAYQDWLDFYLDTIILTNERVIQVEQIGMFKRTVSQLSLDKVQDVTIQTKGILSNFFGFGTITIESAGGELNNFVIHNVPHVERIQSQLLLYAKQAPRTGVEPQSHTPSVVADPPKTAR